MKNNVLFSILLVIGLFETSSSLFAQDKFKSVEELDTTHRIKATFVSKGGFSGDVIKLSLENLTMDTVFVWIESGRRLDNPDETAQDILIVKEIKIQLLPNEKQITQVFGFCCQATNHAPKSDTEFKIGSMAAGNLLWIATFINKTPYDLGTIQQAVWVFSNGNSPASIICNKDIKVQNLRKAISEKLNIVIPWYDIHYKKEANQVFSGKHTRITGEIKFYSNTNGYLLINIRKENGLLMRNLANDMGINGRSYTYPMDVSIENWDTGKYYVNVYLDGNLRERQEFQL